MARLNSPLTSLRMRLARKLDPSPPSGEAWCFGCKLADGANVAFPADQLQPHVQAHKDTTPIGHVNIRCVDTVKEDA